MEELFKKLSEEENCEYKVVHEKAYAPYIFLPLFMRENGFQIKLLRLEIPYKNHIIEVVYELSNNHFGTLKCKFKIDALLPDFQIIHRNPFWRIFNSRFNILKVKCKEDEFIKFIQAKLIHLKIEETARNFLFEPSILGVAKSDHYEIKSTYHLAFSEKKNILRPMINFYKCLIDYSAINFLK